MNLNAFFKEAIRPICWLTCVIISLVAIFMGLGWEPFLAASFVILAME